MSNDNMKDVVGNSEYGLPVFLFLRNQARLRIEGGYFQHVFYHAASYILRRLHNKELYALYSSANIIRAIK